MTDQLLNVLHTGAMATIMGTAVTNLQIYKLKAFSPESKSENPKTKRGDIRIIAEVHTWVICSRTRAKGVNAAMFTNYLSKDMGE